MPDFSWLRACRPRPDWLPRASLALGVGATVAMNVAAGGRGGAGGALVGALVPVAFVLALETLIWLVRQVAARPWGWLWCTGAGLPLAGLAAITGIVSYLHALTVAGWTGSTGLVAHLIPLVPDQLIVCGSVALMAVALAGKQQDPVQRDAAPQQDPVQRDAAPHAVSLVSDRERELVRQLLRQPSGTPLPSRRQLARDALNNNQRAAGRVLDAVGAASQNGHGHG